MNETWQNALYSFRMITEYVWPMVSYEKEASCHVLWMPVECLQMKFQTSEASMWRWLTEWINFTELLTLKHQLVLIAQLCELIIGFWEEFICSVPWFLWVIVSCVLLFLAHFTLAPFFSIKKGKSTLSAFSAKLTCFPFINVIELQKAVLLVVLMPVIWDTAICYKGINVFHSEYHSTCLTTVWIHHEERIQVIWSCLHLNFDHVIHNNYWQALFLTIGCW